MNVTIVDVPAVGSLRIAAAGELGHAPFKRAPGGLATHSRAWARNRSGAPPIVGVDEPWEMRAAARAAFKAAGVKAGNLDGLLTVCSHLRALQCGRVLRMKPGIRKRQVRRMARQQLAWIALNGVATTECQIMDISKIGAKIVPSGTSVVPARFELAFVESDRKRKACEVIWRRGRMLGIKFIE
jgi:hypothetical protein